MAIFELLQKGKGTISSELGKQLAARVLDGEKDILSEALEFCIYDLPESGSKHIRAGGAKTVEIVAEMAPGMVAPHLESLLSALTASEPQTRWMIFRTYGFCAALVPEAAALALPYARTEIDNKEGLIVASSVDLYLGDLGAVSRGYAAKVFPLLKKSSTNVVKNEPDWILEAFISLAANLNKTQTEYAKGIAHEYIASPRKSTKKRAQKLIKLLIH